MASKGSRKARKLVDKKKRVKIRGTRPVTCSKHSRGLRRWCINQRSLLNYCQEVMGSIP